MSVASLPVEPFDLVIFGGTGDLAIRKLLPALYHRYIDGQIRPESRIVGVAREALDDNGYRAQVRAAVEAAVDHVVPATLDSFLKMVGYRPLDARKADGWDDFAAMLGAQPDHVRVFYLSTSPELFVDICERLGGYGLKIADRLPIEIPASADSRRYLRTKKEKLGHLLRLIDSGE